jgi:hypothetical protein
MIRSILVLRVSRVSRFAGVILNRFQIRVRSARGGGTTRNYYF